MALILILIKDLLILNVILNFYRVHFYSRLAFRFYREIACFNCYDKQSLYEGVRDSFDWLNWLHYEKTFNVQVTGRTSSLSHTHFTALEVKNSITDLQRQFGIKDQIFL